MSQKHTASTCKWAKQTISMPRPTWLDAWDRPWTCVRDEAPHPLESTDVCEDCPRWQPREPSVAATDV